MEESRLFSRCFYGLLIGVLILEALESILADDSRRLLRILAVVVLVWCAAMLLNFLIFPAIFRELGRWKGKQRVLPLDGIRQEAHELAPGARLLPHGYLVFASSAATIMIGLIIPAGLSASFAITLRVARRARLAWLSMLPFAATVALGY